MSRLEAKLEKEETKCITFRAGSNDKTYYIPMECSLKETPMDVASVVLWVLWRIRFAFCDRWATAPNNVLDQPIADSFDNTTSETKDAPVSCKGTDVGCGERTSSGVE